MLGTDSLLCGKPSIWSIHSLFINFCLNSSKLIFKFFLENTGIALYTNSSLKFSGFFTNISLHVDGLLLFIIGLNITNLSFKKS